MQLQIQCLMYCKLNKSGGLTELNCFQRHTMFLPPKKAFSALANFVVVVVYDQKIDGMFIGPNLDPKIYDGQVYLQFNSSLFCCIFCQGS